MVKLQCVVQRDSPVLALIGQLLIFPFLVLMLVTCLGIARKFGRAVYIDQFCNSVGFMLLTVYISLSLVVFLPFQCVQSPNGVYSMADNPSMLCWETPSHHFMIG